MKRLGFGVLTLVLVVCLFLTGCLTGKEKNKVTKLFDEYLTALQSLDYDKANSLIVAKDASITCTVSSSPANDYLLPKINSWDIWSLKETDEGYQVEIVVRQLSLKSVYTKAMQRYNAYMAAQDPKTVTAEALEAKWNEFFLSELQSCSDYITLKTFVTITKDFHIEMTKDFMNIVFGGELDAIDELLSAS